MLLAQTHGKKWQKSLQQERDQRIRLEETLEQLAKQHNHLERAFRGATVLPSSSSGTAGSSKGGEGQVLCPSVPQMLPGSFRAGLGSSRSADPKGCVCPVSPVWPSDSGIHSRVQSGSSEPYPTALGAGVGCDPLAMLMVTGNWE